MKRVLLITVIFLAVIATAAQRPTGTATPEKVESGKLKVESLDTSGIPVTAYKVIEPTKRLSDPTQNVVCQFWSANWGKANWPGTKTKPWPFQWVGLKRGLRGKWVCDISDNLKEVNGK